MATSHPRARRRRPQVGLLAVQWAAILVGSLFLIVGVLGFVPGVTSNLDALAMSGTGSRAALFDVFQVSILDNLVHLAVGVVGLVLATSFARARAYLGVGGLLYLGLWVYGLLIDLAGPANVLPINDADNWLHFGVGVTMVLLALTLAGTRVPTGAGGEVLVPPE
ncbi:DUF4383 domain-containing protein [Mycolicibacterium mengxianglii]|uniref:DUF4383 domain-containing protein n=1 Tax=Mycolicibacterium mengxianglii TaxID=2736649 RepID=UPI0018EF2A4D|nr:DUF4383 domain-containing protein [Mycolicibacterium mengxianglii]